MTAFQNLLKEHKNTRLCCDRAVPLVAIKGLASHKVTLVTQLCTYRFYDDKVKQATGIVLVSQCERVIGSCHCMLSVSSERNLQYHIKTCSIVVRDYCLKNRSALDREESKTTFLHA